MKICVLGLWHLGIVTASCLARIGHHVVGHDVDDAIVRGLAAGRPAIAEPGLENLVREGLATGRLRFTPDLQAAVEGAEVVWLAYDTPVSDDDFGDAVWVIDRIAEAAPHLSSPVCLMVSSQVPVGTTRRLLAAIRASRPDLDSTVACVPENLRLGSAIESFTHPPAVVAGVSDEASRHYVAATFAPLDVPIEWMSIESAEVTKHALNSFLAMSVSFVNEVASICERTGADIGDVVRALQRDPRIGPLSYLAPGLGFAGGTLGRDVVYLTEAARAVGVDTPVLSAILPSNRAHQGWVRRMLVEHLGVLKGRRIAVWGLTYKPGTDTLRRSASVELCTWLKDQAAAVSVHDPAVGGSTAVADLGVRVAADALSAVEGADALVVMTGWAEYARVSAQDVAGRLLGRIVLDPGHVTAATLGNDDRLRYLSVGHPS